MTAEQRDAIDDPVAGLQIWCSDCLPSVGIAVYSGSEWTNLAALITNLQTQTADLQAQINAMGSRTAAAYLPSVNIYDQTWQLINLDVASYRDGTAIPEVPRFKEDGSDNGAAWGDLKTGAWCYYTNADGSNEGATYGKLYNWYAVAGIYDTASLNDPSLRKELAPTGWHVPSDAEWTKLTDALGGESVAGGKMKETGLAHWESPNRGATNSSGFRGRPGGYRMNDGAFVSVGYRGNWWSSTVNDTTNAWYWAVYSEFGYFFRSYCNKTFGYSVRCLRD
jgi:uncharacterized protein (TIGR02145 family)